MVILILLIIFKITGLIPSSKFNRKDDWSKFRSKKVIVDNIKNFKPDIKENEINKIVKKMWGNYGRILAEYVHIPEFRRRRLDNYLKIEGLENLEKVKSSGKPTIFISGHFINFELMAMIERRELIFLRYITIKQ